MPTTLPVQATGVGRAVGGFSPRSSRNQAFVETRTRIHNPCSESCTPIRLPLHLHGPIEHYAKMQIVGKLQSRVLKKLLNSRWNFGTILDKLLEEAAGVD